MGEAGAQAKGFPGAFSGRRVLAAVRVEVDASKTNPLRSSAVCPGARLGVREAPCTACV